MPNAATLTSNTVELVERLVLAAHAMPLAMSNLRDAESGFPTSTPGANTSSAPAAALELDEHGAPLPPVKLTIVERTAGQRDPARIARDRMIQLVDQIHNPITELYSLCEIWGFTAARPKIDPGTDHEWCTSCLRLDRCEPRAVGRYREYCDWCGTFKGRQGRLPSVELLDKRHRGIRITPAMVATDHPVRRGTRGGKKARRQAKAA